MAIFRSFAEIWLLFENVCNVTPWPFVYCSISPNLPETGISIAYSFVYIICFIWTGSLLDKTSFYRRWNQIWCFKLTLKYDKIYPTGSVKKILWFWIFFYLTLHDVRHFPHFQAFSIFSVFSRQYEDNSVVVRSRTRFLLQRCTTVCE